MFTAFTASSNAFTASSTTGAVGSSGAASNASTVTNSFATNDAKCTRFTVPFGLNSATFEMFNAFNAVIAARDSSFAFAKSVTFEGFPAANATKSCPSVICFAKRFTTSAKFSRDIVPAVMSFPSLPVKMPASKQSAASFTSSSSLWFTGTSLKRAFVFQSAGTVCPSTFKR